MEDGILSLKWNNHNDTFLHAISTLYQDNTYSDVTLACNGHYYPVHKFILAICSEYFREIFKRIQCQHPIIVLKDMEHQELEILLNYMYAGEANVAQTELPNLIKAAECLKIKGLAMQDDGPSLAVGRKRSASQSLPLDVVTPKRRHIDESSSPVAIELESDPENSEFENNEPYHDNSRIFSNEEDSCHSEVILKDLTKHVKKELCEGQSDMPLDISNSELTYTTLEVNNDHQLENSQPTFSSTNLSSSGMQVTESWSTNAVFDTSSMVESSLTNLMDTGVRKTESCSPMQSSPLLTSSQQRVLATAQSSTVLDCAYCRKPFMYRSDLTRHLRSHTGEKPFNCPFCSYRGNQKTHLHEHIKRKHKFSLPHDHIAFSDDHQHSLTSLSDS